MVDETGDTVNPLVAGMIHPKSAFSLPIRLPQHSQQGFRSETALGIGKIW